MSWSSLTPGDIDLKLISCEIEWTCSRCGTNQRTTITHLDQRVTCSFAGCGKEQIYFEFPQSAFGLSGVNGLDDTPVDLSRADDVAVQEAEEIIAALNQLHQPY